MKIGILTFCHTTNYGAALQAYALQQVLASRGHECEIIDYTSSGVVRNHEPKAVFRRKGIKKLLIPVLYYIYQARNKRFGDFEKQYCAFSEPCDKSTISAVLKKYDRIVVGSDQVWNVDITENDTNFFLEGVPDEKKYSYAASIGKKYFSEESSARYEALVSRFQIISCREKSTAALLSSAIGREAFNSIDPTLLLDNWGITIDHPIVGGDYIFMYLTPDSPAFLDKVRSLARRTKCRIILLKKGIGWKKDIKIVNVASPIDFLNYIKYAKYVITGSFHGLCFSLQFKKAFYITESATKDLSVRLLDLLDMIGCRNRLFEENYMDPDANPLDYPKIEERIVASRNESIKVVERICT